MRLDGDRLLPSVKTGGVFPERLWTPPSGPRPGEVGLGRVHMQVRSGGRGRGRQLQFITELPDLAVLPPVWTVSGLIVQVKWVRPGGQNSGWFTMSWAGFKYTTKDIIFRTHSAVSFHWFWEHIQ